MRPADAPRIGSRPATVLILAVLIAVWEFTAARSSIGQMFFPPPSAWVGTGREMLTSGMLVADLGATGSRLARGLLLGTSLGYLVGIALGGSRYWRAVLDPLIALLHPLPKITLYPLLLIALGLGERPKVAVISIAAFFPIFVTTLVAVRSIDPGLREVVRGFRASHVLTLRRLVIPASVGASVAGLRLSFNSALTSAIALEFVSVGDGLGARIWVSWQSLRTDRLLVTMTVIALIGSLTNAGLQWTQSRLSPWETHAR